MNQRVVPSSSLNETPAFQPSRWEATLALELAPRQRGTRLVSNEHSGPLYVQKPFYPEGPEMAHVYLLHPPGGLVSGDALSITARLQSGSRAVFTTPGAGRIYRARQDKALQRQHVHFRLAENTQLEWLPMETIVFPDAHTQLTTRVELAEGCLFAGWEITCLGLQANQQPFVSGSVKQRFEILQQGRLQIVESFNAQGGDSLFQQGQAGLQGCSVSGFFVLGPADGVHSDTLENAIEHLRSTLADNVTNDCTIGITQVNGFVIIRYLGNHSEQARKLFLMCWQQLRPVIFKRLACFPRIWST